MKNTLLLDGTNLSMDVLFSFLEGGRYDIKVSKINQQTEMTHDEGLEMAILDTPKAYAACYGVLLPKEIGMLSLLLLLNTCLKCGNEIRDVFCDRIAAFINNGIYPCIHDMNKDERSAMSELALILSGEEKTACFFKGAYVSTEQVLQALQLEKFQFNKQELALSLNLCCVSTALSLMVLKTARKLAKTADVCVAMNLEAIRGETGAFDRRLHELGRPYPNQIISAENIRRLLSGSEFTTEKARMAFGGDTGPRCQDAISLRAVPQTHGGVRDTIEWLSHNLEKEINAVSYKINPIIGYSLDLMIIALADLGNISERRSFRLNDSHLSYGLPMNLVGENPGFNHGFPVIQAAATAVLAELKLLALPSTSNAMIDPIDKSYKCATYQAALKSIEVMSLLGKVLAIEMLMAAQAMDLTKGKLTDYKLGKGTSIALSEFRNHVDMTRKNRFAAPDMVEADRLITDGVILKAVENSIGRLN